MEKAVRLERGLAERNHELEGANARLAEANRRMGATCAPRPGSRERSSLAVSRDLPGARFAWHYRPCDELAGDGLNVFALDDRHAGALRLRRQRTRRGLGPAVGLAQPRASHPSDPSSVLGPAGENGSTGHARPAGRGRRAVEPDVPLRRNGRTILHDGLRRPGHRIGANSGTSRPGIPGWPTFLTPARDESPRIEASRSAWPRSPIQERSIALEPGDRLYLYSDGIPEAMTPDNKAFGGDRLIKALERVRDEPLDQGVSSLLDEITEWTGSAGLRDDASIVAVEFLGTSAAINGVDLAMTGEPH